MRGPMLVGCGFMTLAGLLSWRYKDPAEARPRRLGGTMYLVPFCVMLALGLLQDVRTCAPEGQRSASRRGDGGGKGGAGAREAACPRRSRQPLRRRRKKRSPRPSGRRSAKRGGACQRAEQRGNRGPSASCRTTGSYLDVRCAFRAKEFAEHAPGEFGFAAVLIGMFLLGYGSCAPASWSARRAPAAVPQDGRWSVCRWAWASASLAA
jgi:hypothetical protein